MTAKLVELIEAEEHIGAGKSNDPFRVIRRWYTKSGDLVVERDEWKADPSNGAYREIHITVTPEGDLKIVGNSGPWENGYTYKFWHSNQSEAK